MKWDRGLLGAAGAIAAASALAMASAGPSVGASLFTRHAVAMGLGVALAVAVSYSDYRRWMEAAVVLYVLSVAALAVVELAGTSRLGATRWLSAFGVSFQPSELAKFSVVLWLAQYLSGQPRPLPGRAVLVSAAVAALPASLVFLQPDLGSATVLGAIWLIMVWIAGMPRRWLARLGVGAVVFAPLAWHVLKAYQRDRLMAFINPHADPLGTGYTIIQSTIAVGSGQLWGRGWQAGTQSQLNFLPEHHSDFIFAVIGEEWGFLGAAVLIMAFGCLLVRITQLALRAQEPPAQMLAVGCAAWIGYQAVVNLGMVLGLLPVVGVPLPFVSFGGSSMVCLWCALGLLQAAERGR